MNKDIIPNIKSSIVGIGLIHSENNEIQVLGSGFVIDPNEYILTAKHVITDSLKIQQKLKEKSKETFLTIFNFISLPNGEFKIISAPIGENYRFFGLKPNFESKGHDLDIALLRPIEQKNNHPYLPISNRLNFSVLEEVYLCGYPRGNFSFKPNASHPTEISLSPVLQHGRISSLMPSDDAPKHQGIITDIIAVGGSSGSPILEANTGDVIGIAQQVIPGALYNAATEYTQRLYHIETETGRLAEKEIKSTTPTIGYVDEGLVFGFSSIMFSFVASNAREILEESIDLSKFEVNYTKSETIKKS